ncbi:Hsp70 family protein [Anaeropeptidivorans aminofermentans]|uniref:Hsp70 family protein n=1 Tax=Anaeropeptidivorans aminofermentans TaxID=2934315 RepID=UPI002024269E|nr:Hsp70 family protein [Anaeropeptidivorans aminofermentans]MBE6013642.1 VWA domain-containing protein [Lachnospiraceae bacterium]
MSYLGIDLGTTNSVAIIYNDKNNDLDIVKVDGTDEILPSVVNYTEEGVIVGSEAKAGAVIYPETTMVSVKRFMGSPDKITLGSFSKTPEEISGEILKKLKKAAEEQAGETFDEVVITHPAYFNDRQIFATREAGLLAGFKNVFLMSEPLAAAIEYGYRQGYAQTLLVYDLGGGTFDACVLKVSQDENGQEIFQELSDVGDMNLGGDDFDAEIIRFFKEKFMEENNIDLDTLETSERQRVIQKLKQEAEATKKKLSGTNNATARINPLIIHEGVPKNLSVEISREDFEAMIRKYVDRSRDIVEEALKRSGKGADEISKVILVGGSTLIPMVKRMVAGFIKEPYRATDPAKSVAMGAAIYNYLIHLPNSNVKIGQITRQIFGTEAITNIATMEKSLIPIIPMGSAIPCRISDSNFASMSGATAVSVDLYQWEQGHEEAKKYIGSVILSGLSGTTQLEITYFIDENNIFQVEVKDMATGRIQTGVFDRSKASAPPERPHAVATDKVNIVFIIDTTGSMDTYINGVKDRAIEFSEILSSKGASFNLGLIGFGDLNEKEKPSVYNFTNDVTKFQKQVKNIPRTHGGDIPESSLDALETGVELLNSASLGVSDRNIFILITDAPPHVPTNRGNSVMDICDMLNSRNITTYVVARKDRDSIAAFDPVTKPNGKYYDLKDKFYDILDNIALSITELIRL